MDALVEKKIERAIRQGRFENLKGSGKPLYLDDDLLVPEPLRMAWRILKNAGMSPREVQVLNEISALKHKLKQTENRRHREMLACQIAVLQAQVNR